VLVNQSRDYFYSLEGQVRCCLFCHLYAKESYCLLQDLRLVRDKFTHVSRGFAFVHFYSVGTTHLIIEQLLLHTFVLVSLSLSSWCLKINTVTQRND